MNVNMLLRCCTATLLLLVVGCAQGLNATNDDCLKPWCGVHSDEGGESYTTRVTLKILEYIHEYRGKYEYVTGFTSHTVSAEGTVVSRVNVTFAFPMDRNFFERESKYRKDNISWISKSPFVEDFWLVKWPRVSHLSVHVYNMSVNQSYVSNLRAKWLEEVELTGNSWAGKLRLTLELPRLKKLSLSDNRIEDLHDSILDGCGNIEILDLSRNKIYDFTSILMSLAGVRGQLNELNLAENNIVMIGFEFWYFGFHLKKLNFSYNQISLVYLNEIPMNCDIDLSFNNITEFQDRHYYSYIRMDRMLLAGQNISSLSEVGTILSNIDTELFEFPFRYMEVVYHNLASVRALYIPQSQCTVHRRYINCIQTGSNHFTSRDLVNLTGNAVKFPRLPLFEIWFVNLVDLSQNHIKVLEDVPAQISDTKQLNLSRNSIGYMSINLFENMTRLTVLDLSYNNLKHVQLVLYSSLRILDISNNYLNRSNISHSSSQYTTEYLNLSHNTFTNVLEVEWSQFKQFSKVDLGGNDLECCGPERQYSRIMLLRYHDKILNLNSTKALTCVRPFYGRVEMTNAWLSEEQCQKKDLQGWVAVGCLVILFPLLMHAVELLDYFIHQLERDLADQLTRLKKQGLEEDENCALECEYDAFVCHSHKDVRWVYKELIPNMENDRDGQRLCIHYRDFPLGSLIEENIEKAMNKSRKVIVVVTRSFLDSYWCKMELTYAWMKMVRERRNYIIVIEVDRIPEDKRPPILSYLMLSRTYLEWPEEPTDDVKKNCWRRVRDALGTSLRDREQEQLESGSAAFQIDC